LSPMLRLARAVEGINSCPVTKGLRILQAKFPNSSQVTATRKMDALSDSASRSR
jgi:hypothetical protein